MTTSHQAMAALEQAWTTWYGAAQQPDLLTPVEIAVRDVLRAWVAGGRR